jgi:LysM repeat protein
VNDFMSTLKQKMGPMPVWVWALLGTATLALFLIRKKSSSTATDSTSSDQSNSDLGSASELANLFNVAGLMPYQGGDVYVNTTTTAQAPPTKTTGGVTVPAPKAPAPSATYTVKSGDTMASIAKKYGFTAATLWKYNTFPGVRSPSAEAAMKVRQSDNKLVPGETVVIPPKGWK